MVHKNHHVKARVGSGRKATHSLEKVVQCIRKVLEREQLYIIFEDISATQSPSLQVLKSFKKMLLTTIKHTLSHILTNILLISFVKPIKVCLMCHTKLEENRWCLSFVFTLTLWCDAYKSTFPQTRHFSWATPRKRPALESSIHTVNLFSRI